MFFFGPLRKTTMYYERRIYLTAVIIIAIIYNCNGKQHVFPSNLGFFHLADNFGLIGDNCTATCVLNLHHPFFYENKYNANDVFFNISGVVYRNYPPIWVENASVVHLTFVITKKQHRSFWECGIETNTTITQIGSQYSWTGSLPIQSNFTSIFLKNWNTITFTWVKPINEHFVTEVYSWWKFESENEYRQCTFLKEKLDSDPHGICTIVTLFQCSCEI